MTAEERQKAILHNQDIAKLGRLGTEQLTRVGANLYRAVMAAYRKGGTIAVAVEKAMEPVPEIIAKGMALAHLHGRYRGILNAKKAGATVLAFRRTSETYDKAVDWLRKRMEVSKKDLEALEELYSAQALNISKGLETWVDSKMEKAAMDVVAEGMTTREGTRAMAEAMEAVGMVPHNSFTAEALFRTQTKLAYGAARWQENQEEWVQEILWGYKYVTVGDDRVRPTHEALEGMTAPKDDPIWNTVWPPNGWACRCDILDLFDEREIVKPDAATIAAGPDKGFGFNPGMIFKQAAQAPVAPVTTKPEITIPEQPVEKPPEVVPEKRTEERPAWEPGKRTYANESEFSKARAQYRIKLEKEWRGGLADRERIAKEGVQIPVSLSIRTQMPDKAARALEKTSKALTEIEAYMHPDIAALIKDNSGEGGVQVLARSAKFRARSSKNLIELPDLCNKETVFHELGHFIEDSLPHAASKCRQWRATRTTGETKSLAQLTGGPYREDENIIIDDFIDPYVGKIYKTGSTEVLSMGLQQFATPESLRLFAEKDFDHFSFIVGILKGEL